MIEVRRRIEDVWGWRVGRKGVTLLALPDAGLSKKFKRDLEALEFGDAGYVGKRVDCAMGVVGS